MSNIKTLSDAALYLKSELVNEIQNHANFSNPEVSQLADIITKVFSDFEQEVNGYDSQQSNEN